jgi:hypothetical protein
MNIKQLSLVLKDDIVIPLYMYGFTESTGKIAPMHMSISAVVSPPSLAMTAEMNISVSISAVVGEPTITPVIYQLVAETTSDDCTGFNVASFDYTGSNIYAGCFGVNRYKTWIPFQLNFSTLSPASAGFHITSAKLQLTAYTSALKETGKPCKLKIGCDSLTKSAALTRPLTTITNWSPRAWNSTTTSIGLYSKALGRQYYTNNDMDTWNDKQVYEFDVTSSIKELTTPFYAVSGTTDNAKAVTWTDDDYLACMVIDNLSTYYKYRSIASRELCDSDGDYSPATLIINVDNNSYTDVVLDTYMDKLNPTALYYDNTKLIIGELTTLVGGINRSYIRFDLSSIDPAATVNSAYLHLWLEANRAVNYGNPALAPRSNFFAYRILNPDCDLYGMSWNRNCGTGNWTTWATTGAFNSTDCYFPQYISTKAFNFNETVGQYHEFLVNKTVVEGWISGSVDNYGMLLKMGGLTEFSQDELNNGHVFSSSQALNTGHRPYLEIDYDDGDGNHVLQIKVS